MDKSENSMQNTSSEKEVSIRFLYHHKNSLFVNKVYLTLQLSKLLELNLLTFKALEIFHFYFMT